MRARNLIVANKCLLGYNKTVYFSLERSSGAQHALVLLFIEVFVRRKHECFLPGGYWKRFAESVE